MTRLLYLVVPVLCLLATPAAQSPTSDLLLLDVVVTDRDGKPVTDLSKDDFEIQDDGKKVTVESFTAVHADGSTPDRARSLTVLMDDFGVPATGTDAIKMLSNNVLVKTGPADRVAILRLQDAPDRAATTPQAAMQLIGSYVGGARPFVPTETPEDVMRKASDLMRRQEADSPRRHALVCIGSPAVCAVPEVNNQAPRGLYPAWVGAIDAAAETNSVMYAIIPAQAQITAATLASRSGGQLFITTTQFDQAIERIWSELSDYYLVGYKPNASSRETPSIEVDVNRRNVNVRARTRRGK